MLDYKVLHTNHNLLRLRKYLNYELSGSALFILSFMFLNIVFLLTAAALLFTPFMLYVLYNEKKTGWIVAFCILVLIPAVFITTLSFFYSFLMPFLFILLSLFYFYCFLLRLEVNNWLRERNVRYNYFQNKKKSEEELKLFMKRFEK